MATKNAAQAAADEAANKDVTFTFDGVEYTVLRKTIKSLKLRRAFQLGGDTLIASILLGDGTDAFFEKYEEADGDKVMREFFEAFGEAAGTGNS